MFNVKGNNTTVRSIPQSEVMRYFDYRMAIIQVQVGETDAEAWQRHLTETPNDIKATIRVFNTSFTGEKDIEKQILRHNMKLAPYPQFREPPTCPPATGHRGAPK